MTSAVVPTERPPIPRREREFLPAALEIIDTPPSPIGRLGAYVLVLVFALAVTWAWFGRVDIVAVAKGKIIPTGHTKVVQPFEIGVIRAIHVHDGQRVLAGDVLIALDPTINQAELDHLKNDLVSARLDIARLNAALAGESGQDAHVIAPEGAGETQVRMSEQLLQGQLAEHRTKVEALAGQLAHSQAELESQKVSISKIQSVLPMMEERTEMRKTLYDHQSGTKLAYLDSLQELVSSQKDLELQTSHVREIEASIAGATAKLAEIKAEFHRSLLNDLAEATRKAAGLAQDVAKSEQRTKYQVLTTPIDGTVQQLAVHSIGGVVTPAQNLLSIVPADSTLEIEAMVDNQDIGFVHAGQDAAIKVDTFSFTRYGLRHGKVVTVSQDAIPRETSGKPAAAQGNAEESTSASYAARVSLDQSQMQIDDRMVNLSPGMAVTVEIKTGRRRIIDYLLSPLLGHVQESLRER
jgi:hemolysin D